MKILKQLASIKVKFTYFQQVTENALLHFLKWPLGGTDELVVEACYLPLKESRSLRA